MTDTKVRMEAWHDTPPLWLLDSWTYILKLSKKKELPPRKSPKSQDDDDNGHGNSSGSDEEDEEDQQLFKGDDKFKVQRTESGTTSMLLHVEGAALAALCGDDTTAGEDRRDVALVVAMAKMIAFHPFSGVRANPKGGDGVPPLICDHQVGSVGRYRTPFVAAFGIPLKPLLVLCTDIDSFLGLGIKGCLIACGALTNLTVLHRVVSMLQSAPNTRIAQYLDWFITGAAMSDNATSIDLLLRFPPPEWVEVIANFFYLSQAATEPLLIPRMKRSSLIYCYWAIREHLPPCADADCIISEDEFKKIVTILENNDDGESPTQVSGKFPSALHARLVSNIINKKQYPNCGPGGYMDFPKKDIAVLISQLGERISRGGSILVDGVRFADVDLSALVVEHTPDNGGSWVSLTYRMARKQRIQLDLNRTGGIKKTFTQIDCAVRALELKVKEEQEDPKRLGIASMAWNNLAYYLWVDDPESTVTVLGKSYTCIECARTGLTRSLGFHTFQSTACMWDTIAGMLKPSAKGDEPTEQTHFTDAEGRQYSNMDCQLVALGIKPDDNSTWPHTGSMLWKMSRDGDAESATTAVSATVAIPLPIVEKLKISVFEQAVGGKTLAMMKRALPPSEQKYVVGAGGEDAPSGDCEFVVDLTELECYLIGYFLDELGMLQELVREGPEDLQRFITVVTPARISEKGRRIVESHMEGGGAFERVFS